MQAAGGAGALESGSEARMPVVITGGEPMLFAELIPLCEALREAGHHITIETAGTLYLPVACDLMSISPKLSNSTPSPDQDPRWARRHERSRHVAEVIRRLIAEYGYQFKFVVDRPEDCQEVEQYLAEFAQIDRARVLLMPQGTDTATLAEKAQWLKPYCAQQGLRFCPRRQIEWFGLARGT
jgi:7-carboxy-7-deazaguanine synthase